MLQSVNLSKFREIALSQGADVELVVKNTGKKGATLATRTVKVSSKQPQLTKAQVNENRSTRFALYNALVDAGHSQEFLKKVRGDLGLNEDPGLKGNRAFAKPLKNAEVRQILQEATHDQFRFDDNAESGDFTVIEHTGGSLLEISAKDKARDEKTPQVRNQLISYLCDMAAKKGIPLTRAELSPLNVEGLKTMATKLQKLTKPNKPAIQDFKAEIGRLATEQLQVNSNNTLDALQRVKTDEAFSSKVEFDKKEFKDADAQRQDNMAEFLADLSLDFETSVHDSAGSPEARMLQTLQKHLGSLQMMLSAPEKTKMLLMGQLTPAAFVMFNEVRNLAGTLFNVKPGKTGLLEVPRLRQNIANQLNTMQADLDNGKPVEGLKSFNEAVERLVNEQCESLQKMMVKAFEAVVDKNDDLDFTQLMQEADPKLAALMKDMGLAEEVQEKDEVEEKPENKVLLGDFKNELLNTKDGRLSDKVMEDVNRVYQNLTGAAKVAYLRSALQAYLEGVRNNTQTTLPYVCMTEDDQKNVLDVFDKKCVGENFSANLPKEIGLELSVFINDCLDFDANKYVRPNDLKTDVNNGPENADLARIRKTSLADLAGKGALDTSQGYGKFLMGVMSTYFKSVDVLDKRAMVASLIRHAPKSIDFSANKDMKDSELAGATLGAFFKGAGPMMQKTLQQLASMDMPDTFKQALADMRNNLQPLPKKVVHALLADLVEKSNGQIANIKVVKLLGAASVAQSVKCVLTDADGKQHNVVVKLIRPDAENRVKREKDIFLGEARKNGMEVSYQGKIDRVMEEFDLRIEEENAKAGGVYDKKGKVNFYKDPLHVEETHEFDDVHSVKISPLSPNQRSAMIMEEAPGTTLADLLEKTKTESENIVKEHTDGHGHLKGKDGHERAVHYQAMQQELAQLHLQLSKAQQQMLHFSRHWSAEALYGSGFFHGDAHAGNLMVDLSKKDNKGLTAIDFGNATQLTETQRQSILQVIGACYIGDGKQYVKAFTSLLSNEGKANLKRQQQEVESRMSAILAKGTSTDVGHKIAATLNELQRMQIEIPPTIFNFSQCEIMIQSTVEDMNNRLEVLRSQMVQQKKMLDGETKSFLEEMTKPADLTKDPMLPESVRNFLADGRNPGAFQKEMEKYVQENPGMKEAYEKLVNDEVAKKCLNDDYAATVQRQILFNNVADEALRWENVDFSDANKTYSFYVERDDAESKLRRLKKDNLTRSLEETEKKDLKALENKLAAMKLVESGKWEELYEGSSADEKVIADRAEGYNRALSDFKQALADHLEQRRLALIEQQGELDLLGQADNDNRSFVEVMGGVIMDNKAATLWALGIGTAIKFAKK